MPGDAQSIQLKHSLFRLANASSMSGGLPRQSDLKQFIAAQQIARCGEFVHSRVLTASRSFDAAQQAK
jgi:hypothetical protein